MSSSLEGFVLQFVSIVIFALLVVLPWVVVWLLTGPVETVWDHSKQRHWQSTQQSDRRPAHQSRRTEDGTPSTSTQGSGTAAPVEEEASGRIPEKVSQ